MFTIILIFTQLFKDKQPLIVFCPVAKVVVLIQSQHPTVVKVFACHMTNLALDEPCNVSANVVDVSVAQSIVGHRYFRHLKKK